MSLPIVHRASPFSKFSPTLVTVFDNSLSNRCELISHCGFDLHFLDHWASLVAQLVKNPPSVQETWVGSLGWEDSLVKGMTIHSNILTWRIPHGVAESRTQLSNFHFHFLDS